jgi:hypothetical protein
MPAGSGPPAESPTISPQSVDLLVKLFGSWPFILVPSCNCVALGAKQTQGPTAIRRARDSCETGNPRQRGEPTGSARCPKGMLQFGLGYEMQSARRKVLRIVVPTAIVHCVSKSITPRAAEKLCEKFLIGTKGRKRQLTASCTLPLPRTSPTRGFHIRGSAP